MNLFADVSSLDAVTADLVEQSGGGAGLEEPESASSQALAEAGLDGTAEREHGGAVFVHELLRHALLHDLLDFFFNVGNQLFLELHVRRCQGGDNKTLLRIATRVGGRIPCK